MSFLAPLFLAGIAAVSLPIVLHLIRRTPRGRVVFSSLMFLSASPPRVTKRSRLEHWPLLLLRALAVLLLALAFARPFLWSEDSATASQSGVARNVVILLDTSASMQREGLWNQAKVAIDEVIESIGPADRVALLAFDRSTRHIIPFDRWIATPVAERETLFADAVRNLKPGWGSSDVGQALASAADLLLERNDKKGDASQFGPRRIVLISDLQQGSKLTSLQAYEWPAGIVVDLKTVHSKKPNNAGIELLAAKKSEGDSTRPGAVRVRLINSSLTSKEQFQLAFPWFADNDEVELVKAYAPPGDSRVIVAPKQLDDWNGDRIELRGDDVAFDNVVWRVPKQPRRSTVLYLANDVETDAKAPLYYLQRAFPSTIRRVVRVDAVTDSDTLTATHIERADMVVVAGSLADERINLVHQAMKNGKTVIVAIRSIDMNGTVAKLVGTESLDITEADVADYAMFTNIDFTHRYFAPFADPRFGDFTKVRFWHHRVLRDEAFFKRKDVNVVARFDDDSPAVVDVSVKKGRCVILASAWHPHDGQLALSSKFVPLMNIILSEAAGVPRQAEAFYVGDEVDLSWLSHANKEDEDLRVTKPNGNEILVGSDGRFSETDLPGVYTVKMEPQAWRFAVNLDPVESRTAPLDPSELESRGVQFDAETVASIAAKAGREKQIRIRELENRHKIWRGLIVAALAVLLFETWLAGRYAAASLTEQTDSE